MMDSMMGDPDGHGHVSGDATPSTMASESPRPERDGCAVVYRQSHLGPLGNSLRGFAILGETADAQFLAIGRDSAITIVKRERILRQGPEKLSIVAEISDVHSEPISCLSAAHGVLAASSRDGTLSVSRIINNPQANDPSTPSTEANPASTASPVYSVETICSLRLVPDRVGAEVHACLVATARHGQRCVFVGAGNLVLKIDLEALSDRLAKPSKKDKKAQQRRQGERWRRDVPLHESFVSVHDLHAGTVTTLAQGHSNRMLLSGSEEGCIVAVNANRMPRWTGNGGGDWGDNAGEGDGENEEEDTTFFVGCVSLPDGIRFLSSIGTKASDGGTATANGDLVLVGTDTEMFAVLRASCIAKGHGQKSQLQPLEFLTTPSSAIRDHPIFTQSLRPSIGNLVGLITDPASNRSAIVAASHSGLCAFFRLPSFPGSLALQDEAHETVVSHCEIRLSAVLGASDSGVAHTQQPSSVHLLAALGEPASSTILTLGSDGRVILWTADSRALPTTNGHMATGGSTGGSFLNTRETADFQAATGQGPARRSLGKKAPSGAPYSQPTLN